MTLSELESLIFYFESFVIAFILIFFNRLLAIAFVHLGSWVSVVNMLVHQTALVKSVFTNAVVPPPHLSAVTRSVAPVNVNQVLLDHAVMSLALLAHGV